jgi:hypothetical protein
MFLWLTTRDYARFGLSKGHTTRTQEDYLMALCKTHTRVSVIGKDGSPLMPTKASRARRWIKEGKAIPKWNKLGMFYVELAFDPVNSAHQSLAVGIDSGTIFEGLSVVGPCDTVLNIMSEAVTWVKTSVEQRSTMRRTRRYRKTRRRKAKPNRSNDKNFVPPSTKARWDAKLRIVRRLCRILPLRYAVPEDIQAIAKPNQQTWNCNFSPLEVGKQYFYAELQNLGLEVIVKSGMETKALRDCLGLKKLTSKSKPVFETHCIDAWVLAASVTGASRPTTKSLYYVVPLHFPRRQLHRCQPSHGGIRRRYGGTSSLGVKKGTLVHHPRYGLCYVGGTLNKRLSLHCLRTGKRLTQHAKKEECTMLTRISFRTHFLSPLKQGVSLR